MDKQERYRTPVSDGVVLMNMYRNIWCADQDMKTELDLIEASSYQTCIDDFVESLGPGSASTITPDQHQVLGRTIFTNYLAQKGARDELAAARERRHEAVASLTDFTVKLVGQTVHVEVLEKDAVHHVAPGGVFLPFEGTEFDAIMRRPFYNLTDRDASVNPVLMLRAQGFKGFLRKEYCVRPINPETGDDAVRINLSP